MWSPELASRCPIGSAGAEIMTRRRFIDDRDRRRAGIVAVGEHASAPQWNAHRSKVVAADVSDGNHRIMVRRFFQVEKEPVIRSAHRQITDRAGIGKPRLLPEVVEQMRKERFALIWLRV